MDITYLGQSSFKLKGKKATAVTDPYDASTGLKFPKTAADIVTISHDHAGHSAADLVVGEPFVVTGPGEYEIKEVKIIGVASYHDEKGGKERGKNTIFNIKINGLWICHLGDLGQNQLSNIQMEGIGRVDVLLLPVGGVYTIDAVVASKIAAELEPSVVIPMHFLDSEGNSQLEPAEKFLKEMGAEKVEAQPKLTILRERLPEELTVVLLNKVN
ncbi:MAG TPA: MBL fold metallo-hydrolase [Candidatus Nanoarchaeia archaeon]